MATTPLEQLDEHGQSVWIDFLSREFVEDGDLQGLVDQGVRGVTSNPTIFQSAIADGDSYDEQLKEILKDETEPKRSSSSSRRATSRAPATCSSRSTTTGPARTAGSRSRSTRTSPTTPTARSRRPRACTRWSSARTCW